MRRGFTQSNFSLKVCDCENPAGTEKDFNVKPHLAAIPTLYLAVRCFYFIFSVHNQASPISSS